MSSSPLLNQALEQASILLRRVDPSATPMKLAKAMARYLLGPVPAFSNRHDKSYLIMPTTPASPTASAIALFQDEATGEIMVVLQRRPKTLLYCGTGGGFQNVDFTKQSTFYNASDQGEQPPMAAAREINEEIRDDKNKPVLDLDPGRLSVIPDIVGNDYRNVAQAQIPASYVCYYVWLDQHEVIDIRRHIERLKDPSYQKASFENSKFETHDIQIMSLADAARIPHTRFAHPQEFKAIQTLHTHLTADIPPLGVRRPDSKPSLKPR